MSGIEGRLEIGGDGVRLSGVGDAVGVEAERDKSPRCLVENAALGRGADVVEDILLLRLARPWRWNENTSPVFFAGAFASDFR